MKSLNKKDILHRKKFFKFEKQSYVLKFLKNFLISKKDSKHLTIFSYKFLESKQKKYKTKIKTRCVISNRGRGVFNNCLLSRIKFKEFIQLGILPGYKKSIW